MAGDADHEGGEEERRDDGLDQLEEELAEDAQGHGHVGHVVTYLGADHHADQDPGGQRLLLERVRDQHGDGDPARGQEHLCGEGDQLEVIEHAERSGDREQADSDQRELGHRTGEYTRPARAPQRWTAVSG